LSTHGRVLIVDDDQNVRNILQIVIEAEGYTVVGEAANGLEAVRMARGDRLDFIILDMLMPELNGDSTATVLKALCPGAQVVAFSAHLDKKPDWADAYLTKAHMNDLTTLLDSLRKSALSG
jgi:DNA-binding NarL/FixJ family response regulator